MPGKQHEIWFHEKLVNKGDTNDFRANRAEDWTRLRVLDGNTFKPAMDQGFNGMPSSEQMENLYKLAEQGKLVYFAHGEEIPFAVTTDGLIKIDMNPVEPVKPVEPGPNVSRNKYETELQRYPRRMEIYKAAKEVLEKLGDGFKDALNNYNNTRNMEAEQTEGKSRAATVQSAHELHRLENTDRFINDVFGPRPVASPGYFFDTVQNGTNDFVFSYETFDRQFAPNGYDLPENSKLTAQEVATINFAMTGASEFVAKVYREQLGAGEKCAKCEAEGGFQMLVTGCFGKARVAQVQAKNGILKETFKLGKQVVEQYNSGSSEPLGKNLADCVRNIKAVCAGYSWGNLSQDMVAGARVIGRIQELFDKHEDIKQAANLTEKEQQFMRGYVQLGKAYEQYLKSMIKFNDPAAAIMAARAARSAAAQNEAQQRAREIEQAEKAPKQKAKPKQQKQNEGKEVASSQMVGRKLAEYNKANVDAAIGRFALAEEKYMPAAETNTMGLTAEDVGVLSAIACGSEELSFDDARSGKTIENKPDEYYSRIISTRYAEGKAFESKTLRSFHALARREVKNALESGDMKKLGKMLVDGLIQNNKWLAKQTDLTDYYTVYAELGKKLLNIVAKHAPLKQAFEEHLGKNTQQINMANAAKNISDLRVKFVPIKEKLVKDFDNYEKAYAKGVRNMPKPAITKEALSSIGQLSMIQHSMKMKLFDLATTPYSDPNAVDELNEQVKNNENLESFRTKTAHKEVVLDDVSRMATLLSAALDNQKAPMKNQNPMQNTLSKQNQPQQEPPKLNGPL